MDDIFSQLCAGASNELYANPRDCRKYFKCESSGASLQSCPANLIFDTKLKERSSKTVEESDATGVTNELDIGMDLYTFIEVNIFAFLYMIINQESP
jgi:hypothetical protein